MAAIKFFACSAMFVLMAAAAMGNTATAADNDGAAAVSANKRRIARDLTSAIFFRIPSFFGGGDSAMDENGNAKPDFITSFDILRLLDSEYAMKQFYCVVNEDSCDSVGLRLKASIPEAINRDCKRCTSTEMKNIHRIVNYVKKNYPQFWLRVEPLYKDK